MNTLIFDTKSMNVTVTDYTYNVIQHDMAVFQINQNRILNTIVRNLSGESDADYLYQHESYQSLIERIVDACIKKQSVEQLYSISGIPKETLIGYPVSNSGEPCYKSVTKYLGRLFEAYSNLAIKDREKCLFADNFEIIETAISEQKCITVNILKQGEIKTLQIKPYKILADIFTEYYYLVGYSCEYPNGEFEIATFRLSRLNNPKKCRGDYLSQNEIFSLEQRLDDVSPAYIQNKAVEVKVIMTRTGEEKYFRILHNRPNAISKETLFDKGSDYIVEYTFFSSEFQIANYFHQFGADAVITKPHQLHDKQKEWFSQAAMTYEQKQLPSALR